MADWAFDSGTAARLARVVVESRTSWRAADVAEALTQLLPPEQAEELAARMLAAMPSPPVDVGPAVTGYLAGLRRQDAPATIAFEVRTAELWAGLTPLADPAALARLLDITVGELEFFADRRGWLRTKPTALQHYRYRTLPKQSGLRVLEIPKPRLRELQRRVLRHCVAPIPPHPAAHGFVPGRSVHTFAEPHTGSRVVIRVDLRDFFLTVARPQIEATFHTVGYPPAVGEVLAALCTTATAPAAFAGIDSATAARLRRPHLPQGAPTSPALSNLAMFEVDRRLAAFAGRHGLSYTRYADDLAFSTGLGEPAIAVSAVLAVTRKVVAAAGHRLHPRKVLVRRAQQRQQLTGLVVNRTPQPPRAEFDTLRAILYNCARFGPESQNRDDLADFRGHLLGRMQWVASGSATRRRALAELFDRIAW
ncbi:reverse transcriptase domain-containing protein [Nakamurella aerolata]|uniref:RNA-directed DNA polymerase n=1 Tax=Nakamurella aerolata TaxID=1656892 RepID=A0A849A6A0_9ACTN|nr:RNA-directed DNA polymerase [Nakamurella aerolata]